MRLPCVHDYPENPYFDSHCVNVDFLVKIIEQCDSLNNHGVNFVGRELELKSGASISFNIPVFHLKAYAPRQRVTET